MKRKMSDFPKPKFVPKIPVKKEKQDDNPPAPPKPAEFEKPTSRPRQSDHNRDRDRRRHQDDSGGRFGGRSSSGPKGGRGPWVMPTGQAFFTGVATAAGSGITHKTEPRISRATSGGGYGISSIAKPHPIKEVAVKEEALSQPVAEYDSDGDPIVTEDSEMLDEKWPPESHDPLAPLSLPLGPKTAMVRNILAAEPILASPYDAAALDKEATNALFLIQLPSELRMEKLKSDPSALPDGKLGKMQLLRSGKVRLVANDGKTYEVNSGMATSFAQYLAAIDLFPQDPAEDAPAPPPSAKKSKKPAPAVGEEKLPISGEMHFMSYITKKLVVTPDHEIGHKRAHRFGGNAAGGVKQHVVEEEQVFSMDMES